MADTKEPQFTTCLHSVTERGCPGCFDRWQEKADAELTRLRAEVKQLTKERDDLISDVQSAVKGCQQQAERADYNSRECNRLFDEVLALRERAERAEAEAEQQRKRGDLLLGDLNATGDDLLRLRAALTQAEQERDTLKAVVNDDGRKLAAELASLTALAREVVTTLTAGAANGASHAIMTVNLEPVRRLAAALPEETK